MTMFNEYWEIVRTFLDAYGVSYELAGLIVLALIWLLLFLGRGLSFFRFLMRWYQRLILVTGLVALGFWLFYVGREHQMSISEDAGSKNAFQQKGGFVRCLSRFAVWN